MDGTTLLTKWRKAQNKTQRECAEMMGVTQVTWCRWEGGAMPKADIVGSLEQITAGAVPVTAWARKKRAKR